ncbi:hypothetical protein JCGZ_15338 [Jatropha curcas]|uniref:Uncharacterized protein n=1 Tax=Jatropha curcas TaxID=180498 RepID=A0A067K8V3_JATCU|nr:hypothetical protein JCGZ_15338 [Jatropha curcas]
MEAQVEMESQFQHMALPRPCPVSTPVQGGTPQAVQASTSSEGALDLKHARANWHAPDRAHSNIPIGARPRASRRSKVQERGDGSRTLKSDEGASGYKPGPTDGHLIWAKP